MPEKPCEILALAGANHPMAPEAKRTVIFHDGRCWLFDAEERFVAEELKPVTTVYRWDKAGHIASVSGYYGDRETARLRLHYDDQGRLRAANPVPPGEAANHRPAGKAKSWLTGLFGGHRKTAPTDESGESPEGKTTFQYDENERLVSVTSPDGKVTYRYENGLVVGVSRAPPSAGEDPSESALWKFEYAANGQLAAEIAPDGTRLSYNIRQQEGKRHVSIGTEGAPVVADYDPANRPLALTEADGTRTTWRYAEEGAVTVETVLPTGESSQTTWSGDRTQRTVRAADGPVVREQLDAAGRLVRLSVEKTLDSGDDTPVAVSAGDLPMDEVLTQQWRPDGLLHCLDFKTHAILPEYDEHGRVQRVLRVNPANRSAEWQEMRFDATGRVTEVKDCAGGNVAIGYDAERNVTSVTTLRVDAERQEERLGYTFVRDEHGRLTAVNSPEGQETCDYDAAGNPMTVRVKSGQAEAQIEFSEGRPRRVTPFDGGRVEFDYHDEGAAKGQLQEVRTPVIALKYRYDERGRLAEVACGDACRVTYGYDGNGNLVSLEYSPAVGF